MTGSCGQQEGTPVHDVIPMAGTTDYEDALFSSEQLLEKPASSLSLLLVPAGSWTPPHAGLHVTFLDSMFRKKLCSLSKYNGVLFFYYILFYHALILGLALLLCFVYLISFRNKGLGKLVYMK